MPPKDLVVFLEQYSAGNQARLAYAATLAKHWQAHLIAVFVGHPLALEIYAGFAVGPAFSSMLDEHRANFLEESRRMRKQFDALTERRSFTAEWRTFEEGSGEELMLQARHADLAILGPPAAQLADRSMLSLYERLILASGRPCILTPDDSVIDRIPHRVVVGWNGSREATRAISDAMPLLIAAERVVLVVVPEAGSERRLGAEPGADMSAHLSRHGVHVELRQYRGGDAGNVLLEQCTALDADLLVMGAAIRLRIGEVFFGSASKTVLSGIDRPLLLSA